jgi:hypothetical protein
LAAADAVTAVVRIMTAASASVVRNDMSASWFACNISYPNTGRQRAFHHAAASRRMHVLPVAIGKIGTPPAARM